MAVEGGEEWLEMGSSAADFVEVDEVVTKVAATVEQAAVGSLVAAEEVLMVAMRAGNCEQGSTGSHAVRCWYACYTLK